MGLPWVRLDTDAFDHPRFLELFDSNQYRAATVWVLGLAYCGRHETDGYIARSLLRRLEGRAVDAKALVKVGLWEEVDGGWVMPGWGKYQPTAATMARRSEAGRIGANARWHGHKGKT